MEGPKQIRSKWPTFGGCPVEKGPNPLYDQKVLKTDRFRYDFVTALDQYQFPRISENLRVSLKDANVVGGCRVKPPVLSEGLA